MRSALQMMVESQADLELVGEAADASSKKPFALGIFTFATAALPGSPEVAVRVAAARRARPDVGGAGAS